MKSVKLSIALSVALLIGAASAYAGSNSQGSNSQGSNSQGSSSQGSSSEGSSSQDPAKPKQPKPKAVPEIDATSGIPAIALVLGVALLGAERLRRRSKAQTP